MGLFVQLIRNLLQRLTLLFIPQYDTPALQCRKNKWVYKPMQLVKQLQSILPSHAILSSEEQLRPYECDGLTAYKQLPIAVVIPDTVEQVQKIMQLCCQLQVPVVARGAGTGLSGGALPLANGLVISLARFNQILDVDYANRTATVQSGVRNLAISEAVASMGLFYAPDPSSQIACTIGGNVAENTGGAHGFKYGLTVNNILQLKLVTMDGELVTIGGPTLDSPGYDLLALMAGSEGSLGIIVEVVVKLLPKPQQAQVMLLCFDQLAQAGQLVSEIIAAGIVPAGLEVMDKTAARAVEAFVHAGFPQDAEAVLICELDGSPTEVKEQLQKVTDIAKFGSAVEIRVADSAEHCALLWQGCKAVFPAMGRISPDYYCMDGSIRRHCIPQVLSTISELSRQYGLAVAHVFHAGDGNLHPLILYDASKPGELQRAQQFAAEILRACVSLGGSITGEYGVGKRKIDLMCVQFQRLELNVFHQVKAAFDPRNLLNPGKAVPSPPRCNEVEGF